VVALGFFHDPVLKKIIHQFKYNGISAAGEELAELMVPLVPEGIEIITFVPVSRRRFNERGYNQAEILARSLGRLIDRPVVKALNKVKNTERQVGLKRKERLENLRGVFVASDEGKIRGKRVLLIDDVLTTGATLDGCSSVLRDAGAKQVWGLVLARE
jgi:ComF family protein